MTMETSKLVTGVCEQHSRLFSQSHMIVSGLLLSAQYLAIHIKLNEKSPFLGFLYSCAV